MKIGTHNSWSYGRTKWYIPSFVCRCQRWSVYQQYTHGVRLFDLRLRLSDNCFVPAHGSAVFETPFYSDLYLLNRYGATENIYVRVLLEYNFKPKESERVIENFRAMCANFEQMYPNIKFFGGEAKWSWEKVYTFRTPDPQLNDLYSSTTSLFNSKKRWLAIIDDWWPWLYARLRNKRNYAKWKGDGQQGWLFVDFVDMILR